MITPHPDIYETLLRFKGAIRSYGSPGPLRGMKLWTNEGGIME